MPANAFGATDICEDTHAEDSADNVNIISNIGKSKGKMIPIDEKEANNQPFLPTLATMQRI